LQELFPDMHDILIGLSYLGILLLPILVATRQNSAEVHHDDDLDD